MTEKKCNKCDTAKPISEFELRSRTTKYGARGTLTDKCSSCMAVERERRSRKRPVPDADDEDDEDFRNLPLVSVESFLSRLEAGISEDDFELKSRVDLQGDERTAGMDLQGRAYKLADMISTATGLHWTYVKNSLCVLTNGPMLM